AAFDMNVQSPREASAITPARLPAGSDVLFGLFGSLSGPHSRGSTPSVPTSTMSLGVKVRAPGKRAPPALAIGMLVSSSGAPAARTASTGEKTCVLDVAATVIAS